MVKTEKCTAFFTWLLKARERCLFSKQLVVVFGAANLVKVKHLDEVLLNSRISHGWRGKHGRETNPSNLIPTCQLTPIVFYGCSLIRDLQVLQLFST